MARQSWDSTPRTVSRGRSLFAPHRIVVAVVWLITSAAVITMLWLDVRTTDQYRVARHTLHAFYAAALLWYLARSGPCLDDLQEFQPGRFQSRSLGKWISVLVILLVSALMIISDDGVNILMLLMLVSSIGTILIWRKQIRVRAIVQSLALALILYLAGLPFLQNSFLGETGFYLFLLLTPPCYVAGGLLLTNQARWT